MKIGIISDTHNNIELTRKAVEIFRRHEVGYIIHAGDITSPKMLQLFRDFPCRFVLGNGDIDVDDLNEEAGILGYGCIENSCMFEIDGKKFIVFHGNDIPEFRKTVASGKYHYIIKGHTHLFENYVSNMSRIINPGCLYGADCSVAILDLDSDKVEMIRIAQD